MKSETDPSGPNVDVTAAGEETLRLADLEGSHQHVYVRMSIKDVP